MLAMLREGGAGAWLVFLAVGPGAVVAALLHLIVHTAATRVVAASALGLLLLTGGGFMMHGRARVDEALAMVDPDMRAQLEAQGNKEAMRPLELALAYFVPALLLAAVGEVRLRRDDAAAGVDAARNPGSTNRAP